MKLSHRLKCELYNNYNKKRINNKYPMLELNYTVYGRILQIVNDTIQMGYDVINKYYFDKR